MADIVTLRDVTEQDLPIFFEHQQNAEAAQMAAFASRPRDAFMAHWAKILADDTLIKQTILYNGQVAGNIGSYTVDGMREVGYWIGREFWGKGIATRALKALLLQVTARPLYAHVAKHNIASRRVLEKCGFAIIGEDRSPGEGETVEEWLLR